MKQLRELLVRYGARFRTENIPEYNEAVQCEFELSNLYFMLDHEPEFLKEQEILCEADYIDGRDLKTLLDETDLEVSDLILRTSCSNDSETLIQVLGGQSVPKPKFQDYIKAETEYRIRLDELRNRIDVLDPILRTIIDQWEKDDR